MFFRGARADVMGLWALALARPEEDATFWTKAACVDALHVSDNTLVCMLDWGGMEVE